MGRKIIFFILHKIFKKSLKKSQIYSKEMLQNQYILPKKKHKKHYATYLERKNTTKQKRQFHIMQKKWKIDGGRHKNRKLPYNKA